MKSAHTGQPLSWESEQRLTLRISIDESRCVADCFARPGERVACGDSQSDSCSGPDANAPLTFRVRKSTPVSPRAATRCAKRLRGFRASCQTLTLGTAKAEVGSFVFGQALMVGPCISDSSFFAFGTLQSSEREVLDEEWTAQMCLGEKAVPLKFLLIEHARGRDLLSPKKIAMLLEGVVGVTFVM